MYLMYLKNYLPANIYGSDTTWEIISLDRNRSYGPDGSETTNHCWSSTIELTLIWGVLIARFNSIVIISVIVATNANFIDSVYSYTYNEIWWIGGNDPGNAAGNVQIIYTYPLIAYADNKIDIGITLRSTANYRPKF